MQMYQLVSSWEAHALRTSSSQDFDQEAISRGFGDVHLFPDLRKQKNELSQRFALLAAVDKI
jgi:hypothetical protein